jgi:hypothetical protein
MKTFPLWEPATGDLPANILVQFEAHQASLKQELGKSLMAVDPATVISSPANHFIVYKLETAFDIMLAHEQRHFEQARDVRNRFRKFMH